MLRVFFIKPTKRYVKRYVVCLMGLSRVLIASAASSIAPRQLRLRLRLTAERTDGYPDHRTFYAMLIKSSEHVDIADIGYFPSPWQGLQSACVHPRAYPDAVVSRCFGIWGKSQRCPPP
ncbi:hypothetical protein M426DRAFT_17588 [Hypoxylon sp. CI-4A]|nr:hypothetical protein M426DRAFT_17588 [Hypoxylon sp. CI-4A]